MADNGNIKALEVLEVLEWGVESGGIVGVLEHLSVIYHVCNRYSD